MKRYNFILAVTVLAALAMGFLMPMANPVLAGAGISEIVPPDSAIQNYRAVSQADETDLSNFVFIKQGQDFSERPEMTVTIVGCDPATGRNQEVNFTWEQLCISTTYELHIDKSQDMNMPVFSCFITPYDVTSPSLIYLAGGEGIGGGYVSSDLNAMWNSGISGTGVTTGLTAVPSLECGHTYYWRVRTRDEATGDMVRSPWSAISSFTVKAGFKVTSSYYGPQLLAPDNGCGCDCTAPVSFSWSPYVDTTAYKFELSTNADMSSPIVSTQVKNSTAYQWTGTPKCNTSYYWRVMATDPAPSEWSATFTFKTMAAPATPAATETELGTPLWVWVVIGIGAILVIVTLALVFSTRKR
jgi:hypothetical protein